MSRGIIIPAYNEARTIGAVVASVRHAGTVIVVDDCSTDATGALAEEQGAVVVRHRANRGYDGALQSGFERAAEIGLGFVVTFDADGQHSPTVLDAFFEPLASGTAKLVLGIRPAPARLSELLFSAYARARFGIRDLLCGLKGYEMELFLRHGRFDGTRSIGTELALDCLRRGVATCTVDVPIFERSGSSRFGSSIRANAHILRALALAVRGDLKPGNY